MGPDKRGILDRTGMFSFWEIGHWPGCKPVCNHNNITFSRLTTGSQLPVGMERGQRVWYAITAGQK